jgi:outer membrane biosynthesis protein TonB
MKTVQSTSRSQEHWRRWDRTFRWSLVLAALLHVLVVWLFRESHPVPEVEFAAAGEDAGDPEAAAGGGMELITIREVQPPTEEPQVVPVEPIPEPQPVPTVIEPPREPIQAPSRNTDPGTTAGQGRGQDTGPGTDTGTGRGAGGTSDSGTGDVSAPTPRGLILPPSDRPSSVRGKTITVYVFVNVRGTVVGDSTRLDPSTGDRRFDNRLKEQAAEWRFRPATRDGQPVASWFPYTITF